jgi:hypothetical protein
MLPKIINLKVSDDYSLNIFLDDGTDFKFDFTPLLKLTCYQELNNLALFKCAKYKFFMVYWHDMLDIHLDQMIPNHYLDNVS